MNEDYKKLAYERAVLKAVLRLVHERFITVEGADDPEVAIESEDLPRSECVVPQADVFAVANRVQRLIAKCEVDMQKYQHTIVENKYEPDWKEEERKSQGSAAQPGAQPAKGGSKSGKGSPQAPAAKKR